MPRYEYLGPNDHYLSGGDEKLAAGDVVELSESEAESFPEMFRKASDAAESDSSTEEDDSPSEKEESSQDGAESPDEAEAPIDPLDLSVSQLEAELSTGDFSGGELDAIEEREHERDGDARVTALEAIEDAR